jgi:phospholipase/carboxylesterase
MVLSETQIDKHSCLILDPPIIPAGAPVIITLHGLGTNADDLVPFCEKFQFTNCRFVLPDAPLSLPGYPEGAYAWYDFQAHDRKEVEKSRDYLFKVMDRFSNDPNLRPAPGAAKTPTPLILIGFSQGGVMALEAGLNYKGGVAGIVSMSGYMPDPWATLTKAEALFETPMLLVHGTEDEVVPIEGSRLAAKSMKDTGFTEVTLKELAMAHQISEESFNEVKGFLEKLLKAS